VKEHDFGSRAYFYPARATRKLVDLFAPKKNSKWVTSFIWRNEKLIALPAGRRKLAGAGR
jgi:hypothetical protein